MISCKMIITLYLTILLITLLEAFPINRIESYTDNEFQLSNAGDISSDKYYKIYKFKNTIPAPETHGDLVLQFKHGESYSTKIALYNSEASIKQDGTGEFIDYVLSFELVKNEFVLTKGVIEAGDVYIVIYDLKYVYADSFRIFNELDKISLSNNICISIPHLYSKEKIAFNIAKIEKTKFVSFSMSSTVNLVKIPTVSIKDNEIEVKEYITSDQQDYIPISTVTETGKIGFEIYKKEDQVYDKEFGLTLCIEVLTQQITSITNDLIKKKFSFDKPFYFIFDLKPYAAQEENDLFLSLENPVTTSFDGFYCKYVTLSEKSEEDLIKDYPTNEQENQCAFEKDDLLDTSFHLFFKKPDGEVDTILVLVKVKNKHSEGSSFILSIPNQITDLNTDQFFGNLDITVPRYYKIDPNTITNNIIISSSNELALSIIYGSLSSGKTVTKPKYRPQLFAVNKTKESTVIFIKLHGGSTKINFESKLISNSVIFAGGDTRPRSEYNAIINKCTEQFVYFIGSYYDKSDEYISIDTVYGIGNVYHKGSYSPLLKIEENLVFNKIKPLKNTMKVWNNVDLIKITCTVPLSLMISFSSQNNPPQLIKSGDQYRMRIDKGQKKSFEIAPSINKIGIELTLETEKGIINISLNKEDKGQIKEGFKTQRIEITKTEMTNSILELTAAETSIISLKLGNEKLYETILKDEGESKVKTQNVLFELPKTDYYSTTITLKSEEQGLSYCITEGIFLSTLYVPIPKTNCNPLLKGEYTMKIINPYDKLISYDGIYYIGIVFNTVPTKDIIVSIKNDVIQPTKYVSIKEIVILDKTDKSMRTRKAKAEETKQNLIAFTFTPCLKGKVDYTVSFNKEILFEAKDIAMRTTKVILNNFAENDIALLNQGDRIFTLSYVTQKEYDDSLKVAANFVIDVKPDTSNNEIKMKLKFEPFVKGINVEYRIYVIKSNDKNALENPCVIYRQKAYTIQENTKNGFIELDVKVAKMGKYQVNILATTLEGVIMLETYTPIEVEIKKQEDDPNSWIWIVLGTLGGIALIGIIAYSVYYYIQKKKQNNPSITEPFDDVIE